MVVGFALAVFALGGCGRQDLHPSAAGALFAPDYAPTAVARSPDAAVDAAAAAATVGRGGGRRVDAAEAPFLYGSPVGRRFLQLDHPRALARGHPPQQCPAVGIAQGEDAPERALRACLARQAPADDCGCRLLASDDVLLAPLSEFAYAQGVGGRLIGAAGDARPLTVEERPGEGDAVRLAFFDALGPVAVAELVGEDARMVLLGDDVMFTGARERRGWRRGRLSERLLLTDGAGRRLIALIGFEPADVAAEGAGLAAWPRI